jgi:hypothetical protein
MVDNITNQNLLIKYEHKCDGEFSTKIIEKIYVRNSSFNLRLFSIRKRNKNGENYLILFKRMVGVEETIMKK